MPTCAPGISNRDSMTLEEKLFERIPGITNEQADKFCNFYTFLIEENRRINLTAVTEEDDVLEKHFLDSLLGLEHIEEGGRCIDVGSGAGFPGVPLAIMRPDIEILLLDSRGKRSLFLIALVERLGLKNASAMRGRAEEVWRRQEFRTSFNYCLTRAVAPIEKLLVWTSPFLLPGGESIMYKGPNVQQELADAERVAKRLDMTMRCIKKAAPWGDRRMIIATQGERIRPVRKRAPVKVIR